MVELYIVLVSGVMLAVAMAAMIAVVVEYSPNVPEVDFSDHTVVVREVFPCVIYDAADDIVAWHDIVSSLDEIYQEISDEDHAPLADPCSVCRWTDGDEDSDPCSNPFFVYAGS